MPLPFLTADRESSVLAAQAVPLPYADRDLWRRPYRPGPWRVGGGALLLLLASYVLFSALIIAFAGAAVSAAACAGAAVIVIVFALRLLRAGVWVSSHGLRQVGLFRTTTLPWREIAALRTVQRPVRWLGMPRTVQGEALLLTPAGSARTGAKGTSGGEAEAYRVLLTNHNADFLSRTAAFDRAADIIESWAAESRHTEARES
ncbi:MULTISPECIES: PH domain-containing protein [unclassified Streptomyces]|uniref:PH domain-containing protein n=1 Tax=unclassified Streptomyces TaxID=2593676 RepID=UPI002DD8BC5E|nr:MULTISPECIES: PH domain-containing protein [unclassified Streptomyces]WSA92025.1 PH domain-containing protein [Streptomyces sp. NBC_01795]WSB76392.1 PH domain-containing protein [Streptomyces sp. NBC_01775]WSS15333.1 PH domain-containing protein [Streptomyces sp. NBC_01186]WSS44178.1 PH domain-containing protein [Streptomyces sp. NBC_01187]